MSRTLFPITPEPRRGRVVRSIDEPIRSNLTATELWNGPDRGLMACWEQGRRLAEDGDKLAAWACAGELPQLRTWRRGTLQYYAHRQGMLGQDLDIDPEQVDALCCSLTQKWWVFIEDCRERSAEQQRIDARYLKQATPEWCWKRGRDLANQEHRLAMSAIDGRVQESPFFPIGWNRYLALWQGLRGDELDVVEDETYTAIFCMEAKRWWVFTPNTRPGQKWREELQVWLDKRNAERVGTLR